MKHHRVKKVIERAKKETQQKLLEKQIALAGRQAEAAALQVEALKESWWKKNVLPLLSLLLTVFQVMGFGGGAPKPDPKVPPAVVLVVKESDKSGSQPGDLNQRYPTEPFDPGIYNPAKRGEVPAFYTSPIDFPPIPKETDPHIRALLLAIQNSIGSSSDPEAAKLTTITQLELSKQKKLIDEKFVEELVNYVQKVKIIHADAKKV